MRIRPKFGASRRRPERQRRGKGVKEAKKAGNLTGFAHTLRLAGKQLASALATQPANSIRQSAVAIDAPHLGALSNASEIFAVEALRIEGQLPRGIRGDLVRNGPGIVEAGDVLKGTHSRVPHWFDGLGGLLRASLDGGQGTVVIDYRFVRTKRFESYQANQGQKFTEPGFGFLPEGNALNRGLTKVSSAVNTNYLRLSESLAVGLDETGLPMKIDPTTLETLGELDLGGQLGLGARFTAHPKQDAKSGHLFALASSMGPAGGSFVLELNPRGEFVRQTKIPGMQTPPHDYIDAGEYLVFVESPVTLEMAPALLGLQSISESLTWNETQDARVHIIDKKTLEVTAQGTGAAFASAHFGSGKTENDGTISFITFVSPKRDPGGRELVAFMQGDDIDVGLRPTKVYVDIKTGDIARTEPLADIKAEWPVTDPQGTGLWASRRSGEATYFNGYVYLNRETGEVTDSVEFEAGTFGDEATVVPDADDPQQRWLLSTQYVSRTHESQLVVYDADQLKRGPVARFRLPAVVPFAFHGSFAAHSG